MSATNLGNILVTKQTGTKLTLNTNGKYVDNDVAFNIGVRQGIGSVTVASTDATIQSDSTGRNISSVIGQKTTTAPSSGYYIKVGADGSGECTITTSGWVDVGTLGTASASASFYFPIDAATATVSGINTVTPSASVVGNNVSLSNTDNGISITATGGGTASASVSAVGDNAGYAAQNVELGTATIAGQQQTTSASTYISGVTIPVPETGTNTFTVTLPNGAGDTITLIFEVDSEGNSTVTDDTISATGVSF